MYGRRRGGGRGFRPNNAVRMGTVASRSSPDGPARGGFYNSGYRNFNRGFGRGQGRYFNSPQPLRKGDVFMEAGRLAAEYLVAKGMLPPNALPPKFQNGGFRKEVGELQEFRQEDGEYMQVDSRASALARLGSFEGVSERKRYPNDYSAAGYKNNLKGRRETASFSNYDSERGQENGKSGSISGRSRVSSDKEADDDALSVHRDDQLTTKYDEQNNKAVESAPKSNCPENSLSEVASDTDQLVNDLSSKTSVSVTGKDSENVIGIEGDKGHDGFGNNNLHDGEMKEFKNDEVMGQYSPVEDSIIQPNQVAANPTQKGNELLQLCTFAKVPTRTRSLRSKGSKGSQCTTVDVEKNSVGTSTGAVVAETLDSDVTDRSVVDTGMEQPPLLEELTSTYTPVDPELLVDDEVVGLSKSNAVLDQNHDLMTTNIMSMHKSDQSLGKTVLLDLDSSAEGSKCLESLSFPGRSFAYSEKSSQGPLDGKSCSSIDEFVARVRGEKRVLDDSDLGGTFKKLKSWPPSVIGRIDEYSHPFNLRTEGSTVIERTPPANNLMMIGQQSSGCIPGFATLGVDNSIRYADEKQMIDSSFKICDLNLMEGSHIDDNHDGSQMFFPSMSELKEEPVTVDGGLTIGENSNMSHKYSTVGAHGKEIELINLDNDFDDETAFNNEEKREDAVYTGLESFPSQPRGTGDGTDVQEYRFMISELLGNEIPSCSTVAGDINSLHDDMGLHNGQGILPEDDPIYMTLGEIPIGFWEPPNPEFGKPF